MEVPQTQSPSQLVPTSPSISVCNGSVSASPSSPDGSTTAVSDSPSQLFVEHSRPESVEYFKHQASGKGPEYLVSLASYATASFAPNISGGDTTTQISILSLSTKLTRNQREELADVVSRVHASALRTVNHRQPGVTIYHPKIPSTPTQFDSQFTRGRHSMTQNLPYPKINNDVPDHAYVSFKDALADFLAHSFDFVGVVDEVPPLIERPSHVPLLIEEQHKIQSRFGMEPHMISFKTWSDSYEKSYSRINRNSIWVKLLTFEIYGNSQRWRGTYPLIVGSKSGDHDLADRKITREILSLQERPHTFFSGFLKRNVQVVPVQTCKIGDQPERRDVWGLAQGNHTYHPRFGYSICYRRFCDVVPSCEQCIATNLSRLADCYSDSGHLVLPPPTCDPLTCADCLNWVAVISDHPLSLSDPPSDYPPEMLPGDKKIRPHRISPQGLLSAMQVTQERVLNGQWSEKSALAYLSVECLSSSVSNDIVSRAIDQRRLRLADDHRTNPDWSDEVRIVDNMFVADPSRFVAAEPKPSWIDGTDLFQSVDATMHILFHGVVKTVFKEITQWVKDRKCEISYSRYCGEALEHVISLKLDWCKVCDFNEGYSGWLAENFVGLSKMSAWFVSGLRYVTPDPVYEQPTTDPTRWRKPETTAFLRSRQVEFDSNASAAQLKSLVLELFQQPGGPPPVAEPTGCSIDTIFDLVVSMNQLVNVIMSPCLPSDCASLVRVHVIRFLDCYKKFQDYKCKPNGIPSWLSKMNFLCLLNLPEACERLGPPRWNYEGSTLGEGFLPYLKPLLKMGMRNKWATGLLTQFYSKRAVKLVQRDTMLKQDDCDSDDDQADEFVALRKQFVCYKNKEQLETDFELGHPLSVVYLSDGSFGCLVGKDMSNLISLQLSQWHSECVGQQYYLLWPFIPDPNPVGEGTMIKICGMLLPMMTPRPFRGDRVVAWSFVGSNNECFNKHHQICSLFDCHSIERSQIS